MVQLEHLVDTQLKQLPNTHEVAGLLDDISFIATDNGLTLNRINWEPEVKHEFSTGCPCASRSWAPITNWQVHGGHGCFAAHRDPGFFPAQPGQGVS